MRSVQWRFGFFAWMIVAVFALAACSSGGSDSGEETEQRGTGDDDDTGPYVPPDDDGDDDGGGDDDDDDDDADDDNDDDIDDDDTGGNHPVLIVTPDPEDPLVDYYEGSTFTYVVGFEDAQGNYLGDSDNYEMSIAPGTGFTHDDGARTITFNRDGEWTMKAEVLTGDAGFTNEVTVTIKELLQADITFTSPPRGLFSTRDDNPGGTVTVRGECTMEGNPCDHVEINGTAPDDYDDLSGEFETVFGLDDGLNTIVAEGFTDQDETLGDANTSVLYGDYLTNDAVAEDAIGMRITQNGLATVELIAETLIDELDLNEFLPGPNNPECPTDPSQCHLYDSYDCFWDICTGATADIEGVNIGPANIELTGSDLGLMLYAEIPNLDIGVHVEFEILGIGGSTTGNITADSLTLTARAVITANPDGTLAVSVVDVAPTINGLSFDNFGLLGDILSLFTGVVEPIIESILPDLIAPEINEAIQDALSDLDLSTDFSFLDKTFFLAADFGNVVTDSTGLLIWMDAQMTADSIDPDVPDMPGSWKIDGALPAMGGTIPGMGTPYAFGVALDDDIVNQVLYEIFRSGVLNFEFTDDALTTLILSPFFPQLLLIHPNAPVILRTEPMLQPVLNMNSSRDVSPTLQLGDFLLSLLVDHPSDGEVHALSAAMSISLPTTVGVDADGAITLTIDTENYFFEVTIIDEAYDFNDALLEDFMPTVVDLLVPYLDDLLGAIEIPSFEGYTLDIDALIPIGAQGEFIGLYGDLVAAP
ncbi:MAG: hypothetical protein IT350_07910 [Deltaproteobacteria bacterium]|nr:hypothetical protein [Deltaproteobacteria bacterium]